MSLISYFIKHSIGDLCEFLALFILYMAIIYILGDQLDMDMFPLELSPDMSYCRIGTSIHYNTHALSIVHLQDTPNSRHLKVSEIFNYETRPSVNPATPLKNHIAL